MSKLKVGYHNFNPETKEAVFTYNYKGHSFIGKAKCHEEDYDFCSEKMGLTYAECRAYLKYLKYRRNELQIKLTTLTGLYNNISTDKHFKHNSSIANKIRKEIDTVKQLLINHRELINEVEQAIKDTIKAKEQLYTKLRNNRNA